MYTYNETTHQIINPWNASIATVQDKSSALLIVDALNNHDPFDIRKMSTERLTLHVQRLYREWEQEEAAEFGYDAKAARTAFNEYLAAAELLKHRTKAIAESVTA